MSKNLWKFFHLQKTLINPFVLGLPLEVFHGWKSFWMSSVLTELSMCRKSNRPTQGLQKSLLSSLLGHLENIYVWKTLNGVKPLEDIIFRILNAEDRYKVLKTFYMLPFWLRSFLGGPKTFGRSSTYIRHYVSLLCLQCLWIVCIWKNFWMSSMNNRTLYVQKIFTDLVRVFRTASQSH